MARVKKTKKPLEVAKFGGVEELGQVKTDLHQNLDGSQNTYDSSAVEAQSQTRLEDDHGEGVAVVIRCFTFQINLEKPEEFLERRPTKQDIFNSHIRGIEMALWRDGLQVYDQSAPKLTFDTTKMQYSIFVPAIPMKGHMLHERPKTLTELAHG